MFIPSQAIILAIAFTVVTVTVLVIFLCAVIGDRNAYRTHTSVGDRKASKLSLPVVFPPKVDRLRKHLGRCVNEGTLYDLWYYKKPVDEETQPVICVVWLVRGKVHSHVETLKTLRSAPNWYNHEWNDPTGKALMLGKQLAPKEKT